jgi:hypothetical protein
VFSSRWIRFGQPSRASSATVQPFFRSSGAISPRSCASADSRGSVLANRCRNRSCRSTEQPPTEPLQHPHPYSGQRTTCHNVTPNAVAVRRCAGGGLRRDYYSRFHASGSNRSSLITPPGSGITPEGPGSALTRPVE